MADVIRKATNRFTKGLVMDFSPENTKNELLTHALNATLLTFNGNELSLQNDMGNGRVETAYLPDGYMPVGTCEYGGIIYIVSYNPLEDKSQIGCFPSPERNISNDELGIPNPVIKKDYFQEIYKDEPTGNIKHNTQYVLLKNDKLNPGDKFIVTANKEIYNEKLADLWVDKDWKHYAGTANDPEDFELVSNPIIALNVVSIEDSGKIIYLNSDIRHYDEINTFQKFNETYGANQTYNDIYRYHILGKMSEKGGVYDQASVDLDNYRDALNSGYSVFKSKTSGKLAILAELIMIDSYSVTHSVVPKKDGDTIIDGAFDIVIHTEITPELTNTNYNIAPKLKYYYLENSQGNIQVSDIEKGSKNIPLFKIDDTDKTKERWIYNSNFFGTSLSSIYVPTDVDNPLNLSNDLKNTAKFGFPLPKTYHGKLKPYGGDISGTANESLYTKFEEGKYHRIDKSQVQSNWAYYEQEIRANFFYYDSENSEYTKYEEKNLNESYTYFIRKPNHIYHDVKRNEDYRYAELYILATQPLTASDTQKKDTTIEKFQKQEIHSYTVATNKDIEEGKKLYYTTDGGSTYIQLTGTPEEGVTYYTLKVEETLVSVGFEDATELTGTVYYFPSTKEYSPASEKEIKQYFDFETYPFKNEYPYGCPITLYHREEKWLYEPATEEDKLSFTTEGTELYYNTSYILVEQIQYYNEPNQLFIVVPMDVFVDSSKFIPNESYNWIEGRTKPSGTYTKDDPISLYTLCDFIPQPDHDDSYLKYNDVKLANIKLPSVVSVNGLDLPFKYDYTIVPCMNYGKLQHLAVSNTVDFSKLHAFNQSKFSTWKYRIDESQLRLTFGTDVYDTYEESKVDGIIIEFYDCWGFAGSLEILDKKSYSGIFTKVIPLNSLKALSQYRVLGNKRVNSYKRNINIKEKYDEANKFIGYTFDTENFDDGLWNEETGWSFVFDKLPDELNDCGTLYTNIVYGVKTYFRRTLKNGEKEYIKKQDFYLYTLPIYNDYYYTVQDFSNLENPELNLALTYKLKDSSTKAAYSTEDIINGYNKTDKENLGNYLGGFYNIEKSSSLDLIKYYKYKGTSELYLEVGLNKEYENLNLSYDPLINDRFQCSLQLISDDDKNKTLTVNSGVEGMTGVSQVLNYNNGLVTILESVNVLGFEDSTKPDTYQNQKLNFKISNANFINREGGNPVKINYEFVVGYTASISNIRNTQVQATTVCALFHKNPEGEYNYSDFGVYEQYSTDNAGNTTSEILSDVMFYNEGTSKKEIFGICRQTKSKGTNVSDECQSITSVETDAQEIKTAGKLNTGDPLRQLVGNIGKLTFCQPHAHGISEGFGVNIHEGSTYPYYYGIPPEVGDWDIDHGHEDTWATVPRSYMFNNPKYNLCINTKNSINYHSEFISTLDFNIISNREIYGCNMSDSPDEYSWKTVNSMREYTGLTGQQIATFNKKMLETMKSVYAYNPDYDSLTVNKGNVTLQTYNPYFTSNLLSIDSKLNFNEGETLNNFVYLGPIKFSQYLIYLNKFSSYEGINNIKIEQEVVEEGKTIKKPIPQLELTANYDYCGTPENYCLISSLTYNTPVPQEIEQELEFSASNLTVIKHSNGENSFMQGTPNRKTLYGYNSEFDKMIQLDVSNYTIDENGVLTMKNEGAIEKSSQSLILTDDQHKELYNSSISIPFTFTNTKGETNELDIRFSLGMGSFDTEFSKMKYDNGYFVLGTQDYYLRTGGAFTLYPSANIYGTYGNYKYSAKIDSIDFECLSAQLNDSVALYGYPIALFDQSYSELHKLTDYNFYPGGAVSFIDQNGNPVEKSKAEYLVTTDVGGGITINGSSVGWDGACYATSDKNGNFNFNFNHMAGIYTGSYVVGLIELKIRSITLTVTQTSKLETTPECFINTTRTNKYSKFGSKIEGDTSTNHYIVLSDYNNTRLRGSSLTINDLIYEPNKDGHRLFIRNNLCVHKNYLRGKLYYRALDYDNDDNWYYDETKYLNTLFFFTGPCYTTDNL